MAKKGVEEKLMQYVMGGNKPVEEHSHQLELSPLPFLPTVSVQRGKRIRVGMVPKIVYKKGEFKTKFVKGKNL